MAADMLSSLPVELLAIVVAHLEWEDYAAFRLTCRRIEAVLFPSFARDSFTTCHVMRTPESIQTLIDISKSRLGPFVQQLGVSAEVLRSTNESSRGSQPSGPSEDTSLTADQDAFISTGRYREMLAEALLKLQSVQLVQIRNVYSSALYSMSTAPRDPSAKQRSLGLKKIILEQEQMVESAVNRERPTVQGDKDSARACLHSTLLALGKADARPRGLEVAGNTDTLGFNCKAFHIPACISSSIIPVLAQLENLVLSVSPGSNLGPVRCPVPFVRPIEISTYDLRTFLEYTTQLKILDINFNCLENLYDGFIEWLASVPPRPPQWALPWPGPAIAFNCLQALSLHYIYGVRVQELLSVVQKFAPTLQNLYLHRVHLETHLQGDQASAPRAPGSVWIEFLRSLKVDLSDKKLRYLRLTKVMETEHIGLTRYMPGVLPGVTFAKGRKRYGSCSYSGPAMEQALEAMIHCIESDGFWVPPPLEGNWRFSRRDRRKREPGNDFSNRRCIG